MIFVFRVEIPAVSFSATSKEEALKELTTILEAEFFKASVTLEAEIE